MIADMRQMKPTLSYLNMYFLMHVDLYVCNNNTDNTLTLTSCKP